MKSDVQSAQRAKISSSYWVKSSVITLGFIGLISQAPWAETSENGLNLAVNTVPVLEDSLLLKEDSVKTPSAADLARVQDSIKAAKEEEEAQQEEASKKPVKRMTAIKVRKPKLRGSASDMLAKRSQAGLVMEGVSAEQIAKSTDSDAGALAKRVTGTSVVGGKFVFVRGLGERYTSMTLNGLPVPSPEKGKRIVPQDLFPASALENFAIYKTFNPKIDPHFAGGHIALETKGIPDKDVFKVSVGTGGIDYSGDGQFLDWGKDFQTYEGGDGWQSHFGFDDGTRALPGVPTKIDKEKYTDEERAGFQRQFSNIWNIDTMGILPQQSYGISYGKVYEGKKDSKWGFIVNAGLKRNQKTETYTKTKLGSEGLVTKDAEGNLVFPADSVPKIAYTDTVMSVFGEENSFSKGDVIKVESQGLKRLRAGSQATTTKSTEKITLTGIFNAGYEDRDTHYWLKMFHATLSEDKSSYIFNQKVSGVTGMNDDFEEQFLLQFERRSISTAQIGGGHYTPWGALDSISWAMGYALTDGNTPDLRMYKYARKGIDNVAGQDTSVYGREIKEGEEYKTLDPNSMKLRDVSGYGKRAWEELGEWSTSGRMDFFWVIPPEWEKDTLFNKESPRFGNWKLPKAKSGFGYAFTKRSFNVSRYGYDMAYKESPFYPDSAYYFIEDLRSSEYLDTAIVNGQDGFASSPNSWDRFEYSELVLNKYLDLEWAFKTLGMPTSINVGGRVEMTHLNFEGPYTGDAEGEKRPDDVVFSVNEWDFFPGISMDLEPIHKLKTRLLWSRTLVRPSIREISPFTSYNFDSGDIEEGNPDLKVAEIYNYDFRMDYFLPYNQILSLSLFYKQFHNPIEATRRDGGGGNLTKTWINAEEAVVQGVEGEFDVKLDKVIRTDILKGWSFYTNAAWIHSLVKIDPLSSPEARQLTTFERPMVGQSPYLINFKLSHEVDIQKDMNFLNAFLYNKFGERLKEVGQDDLPDRWEQPFVSLDFLSKFKWDNFSISLKIKNILDSEKTIIAREFNHTKDYNIIDGATRDLYYENSDGFEEEYVVESKKSGTSYGISMSYGF